MKLIRYATAPILGFAVLAFVAWLSCSSAYGQPKDAKFGRTRDPNVISQQIKAALPPLERGFSTLITSTDPEPVADAVNLLNDAYRYLRAAEESSEVLQDISKFPDPVVDLRNRQIWSVRMHLIACHSHREYLANPGVFRTRCINGLEQALRTLRLIVVTLP